MSNGTGCTEGTFEAGQKAPGSARRSAPSSPDEQKSYLGTFTRFLFYSRMWSPGPEGGPLSFLFYVVVPAYSLFFLTSVFEMGHNWGDLNAMTETIDMTMIFTVTGHKVVNVMWEEKEWKRLIRIVENNYNRPARRIKREDRLIMEESVRMSRYVGLVWAVLVCSMLASFTIRPLVESFLITASHVAELHFNTTAEPQTLPSMWDIPYRTWTPFDNMPLIVYGLVYFLHVFVASLQIFLVPTYDMFFIALVNYTCGQFRILQRELRIIREDSKAYLEERQGAQLPLVLLPGALQAEYTEAGPALAREMHERVRDFVEHHETLLKFAQDIEELVNRVLLNQFLCSSFIICTTTFHLADKKGGAMKLFAYTELLLAALFQLGMFCYFADLLVNESIEVGNAVYKCEWYHSTLQFRRSVSIIMSRALRPCYITFGRFTELSLETYAGILRISFGYYTVLNGLRE